MGVLILILGGGLEIRTLFSEMIILPSNKINYSNFFFSSKKKKKNSAPAVLQPTTFWFCCMPVVIDLLLTKSRDRCRAASPSICSRTQATPIAQPFVIVALDRHTQSRRRCPIIDATLWPSPSPITTCQSLLLLLLLMLCIIIITVE